jgi:outer membrane protein W
MKSKSITFLLPLLLAAASFLVLPSAGRAALWIGLQGGPNFVTDSDIKGQDLRIKNVKTETAVLGGVTIGYDFVKDGFLGYDWPNWLKYFSCAIDVTYNNFSQKAQDVQIITKRGDRLSMNITPVDGHMLVLSFLLIAKYGFLPTPELPFGRLIPYVGVGPGMFFSVAETDYSTYMYPSSDSAEFGIVTEAGIRYMVRPNISLDAAFRYRYVTPSYDVAYYSNVVGEFYNVGRIFANQFNAIFRLNYHF